MMRTAPAILKHELTSSHASPARRVLAVRAISAHSLHAAASVLRPCEGEKQLCTILGKRYANNYERIW